MSFCKGEVYCESWNRFSRDDLLLTWVLPKNKKPVRLFCTLRIDLVSFCRLHCHSLKNLLVHLSVLWKVQKRVPLVTHQLFSFISIFFIPGMTAPDLTEYVASLGGYNIFTACWKSKIAPKAIVHIVHGYGEHLMHYDDVAPRLNTEGYLVFAHDHFGKFTTLPQDLCEASLVVAFFRFVLVSSNLDLKFNTMDAVYYCR